VAFAENEDNNCDEAASADLLVIDEEQSDPKGLPDRLQLVAEHGHLVLLGRSLDDDSLIALMRGRLDHAISDASPADETDLIVTAAKLLGGDIFGLEKYLAWGANIHELDIRSYEEKRIALLTITAFAKRAGARRPLVARIESAADELLMNAMYNAPAMSRGEVANPAEAALASRQDDRETALLRYATDGRHFAISVEDRFGVLRKESIIDNLTRARTQKSPRSGTAGGAGLGLYFVFSCATRFIANIDPGEKTEIVCLFDLREGRRDMAACARALHVFRERAPAPTPLDFAEEHTEPG